MPGTSFGIRDWITFVGGRGARRLPTPKKHMLGNCVTYFGLGVPRRGRGHSPNWQGRTMPENITGQKTKTSASVAESVTRQLRRRQGKTMPIKQKTKPRRIAENDAELENWSFS